MSKMYRCSVFNQADRHNLICLEGKSKNQKSKLSHDFCFALKTDEGLAAFWPFYILQNVLIWGKDNLKL